MTKTAEKKWAICTVKLPFRVTIAPTDTLQFSSKSACHWTAEKPEYLKRVLTDTGTPVSKTNQELNWCWCQKQSLIGSAFAHAQIPHDTTLTKPFNMSTT